MWLKHQISELEYKHKEEYKLKECHPKKIKFISSGSTNTNTNTQPHIYHDDFENWKFQYTNTENY